MTVRPTLVALAALAALSLTTAAPAAYAADGDAAARSGSERDIARAYAGTAKYAYEPLAVRDGYMRTDECVSDPELGGMGYHYVKGEYINSTDPAKPAALLYEDGPRGRQLVGIEYITIDADQDLSTDDDRPTMFGQPFDGPMEGHEPGMPIHYDLHVWLYKHNPSGTFAQYNPNVHCPED